MLLWNAKYVRPPPISSVLMSRGDLNIDKLELVCSRAVSVLDNQKQLHMEAALLSRVLYRMKSKYRQNIGFKNLEKVNRGLLQYLSLDLFGVYSTFTALVPQVPRDPQVYLPTRQMLEWVLVRTQGFARLFCFIAEKCREAARHFHFLVTLGHTWETALLCMGLASRIWCIAKYMVTCSCDWYSQLKPFLQELKSTGRNWLPSGYEFPEDLIKWLDAPWLTEHHKQKSLNPKKGMDKVLSRLMGPSNGDDEDEDVLDAIDIIDLVSEKVKLDDGSNKELLEVDDTSESKNTDTCLPKYPTNLNKKPEIAHGETKSITSVSEQWNNKEDIGEKISRTSMKRMVANLGKEARLEPQRKKQKIETLMNISSLKHVEEVESKHRGKRKEVPSLTNGILKKVEEEDKVEEVILEEEEDDDEMKKEEEEDYSDVVVEDPEESISASDKTKKLTMKSMKKFDLKLHGEGQQIHDSDYLEKRLAQDESKFVKKKHGRIFEKLGGKSEINRLQGSQVLGAEAGARDKVKPPKTKGSIPKTSINLGREESTESINISESVPSQEIKLLKSKKQQINSLKTVSDLETFLSRESKLRDKCSKKCLTREMDKLQWNMFYNAISVYVNKLNKKSVRKDKERYESLMKKARKAIKLRIL